MLDVDALAQEIRRVDGKHSLGAGELAEALMPFLSAALAAMPQEPVAWLGEGDGFKSFTRKKSVATGWAKSIKVTPVFASPAQGATAPAVKALEWTPFTAESALGLYEVVDQSASNFDGPRADRAPFLLSCPRKGYSRHNTLADAKAAAQADFERRIRSCLTGAAPSPSEEDDLVTAAWPAGCYDPGSCERNRACTYLKCPHEKEDIAAAIRNSRARKGAA